jgi:hypothetical protein
MHIRQRHLQLISHRDLETNSRRDVPRHFLDERLDQSLATNRHPRLPPLLVPQTDSATAAVTG